MPDRLERDFPLFPLGMVALPSEVVPLHIFEPRYRTMISECLESEREFGIVWSGEGQVRAIGCAVEITSVVEELPDGRMNILTTGTRPFRVEPLPRLVTVAEVLSRTSDLFPLPGHVCLGVGGDELLPAGIQLPQGDVLAVLGGQASGKSSLLSALPGLNPGASWLRAPAAADPERYWAGVHETACSGGLNPAAILLVDDLDLQSPEANSRLLLLNRLGWPVVLTAGFSPGIRQRVPLVQNATGQVRGVLIAPRSLLDGELFGVRFDLEQSPPPGRAVVISDGRSQVVQLAFDPAADCSARGP